MHSNTRIWD